MPVLGRETTMWEHRGTIVSSYSMEARRSSCQKQNSQTFPTEILHSAVETRTRCMQGAEIAPASTTQWDWRRAGGKGNGCVKQGKDRSHADGWRTGMDEEPLHH